MSRAGGSNVHSVWEELARWLDETFGALYRPLHDSHKQARERRTTNCLQQYRNVLRNTPYLHANLSSKGNWKRVTEHANRATQICTHVDKALQVIVPIVWVVPSKEAPSSAQFCFPYVGKHGVYLDINCQQGLGIMCNVSIAHGSSSFQVDWADGKDLCGIELSLNCFARKQDDDEVHPYDSDDEPLMAWYTRTQAEGKRATTYTHRSNFVTPPYFLRLH